MSSMGVMTRNGVVCLNRLLSRSPDTLRSNRRVQNLGSEFHLGRSSTTASDDLLMSWRVYKRFIAGGVPLHGREGQEMVKIGIAVASTNVIINVLINAPSSYCLTPPRSLGCCLDGREYRRRSQPQLNERAMKQTINTESSNDGRRMRCSGAAHFPIADDLVARPLLVLPPETLLLPTQPPPLTPPSSLPLSTLSGAFSSQPPFTPYSPFLPPI
ncbi:hypothetical protein KC347_g284 [Hortaea werneckii]|nr:hypothetical protein KC347_g284 [Hortaea werneckii]